MTATINSINDRFEGSAIADDVDSSLSPGLSGGYAIVTSSQRQEQTMSRIIELTTTVTLRVDDTLAPEMLCNHVRSRLKTGFGGALSDHPMAVRIVAVRDPDGDLFQAPYLRQMLAGFGQTAIVWSVNDVLDIRPDLTHEQAAEVLQQVIGQHDPHHGICRDDFESMATELYEVSVPDPDDAEVSP